MKITKKGVFITIACLIIAAPLPSFSQILPPIDRLAVYDNNGTRIGPVVTLVGSLNQSISGAMVPIVIDDFLGIVRVGNTQFYGVADVFYSSANCTGQPMMLTQQEAGSPFEETFAVIGVGNFTGNIVWKIDPNSTPFPAGTSLQSVILRTKECVTGPVLSPGTMIVNAIQVFNLDTTFTPPFNLQPDVAQMDGGQAYDLNGDGKADLVWRNKINGVVAVWLMNGAAVSSTAFLGGVPSTWEIEQVSDVNGDGKADVVWQNVNGTVAVWLMNGTVIESVGFPGGVSPEWEIRP